MNIRTITESLSQRLNTFGGDKASSRYFRKIIHRRKSKLIRYGLLTANIAVVVAVVVFVTSNPSKGPSSQSNLATAIDEIASSPLDQLSSADIAANVASMTQLEEATHVANQADSYDAQLIIAAQENSSIATKPQVVTTDLKSQKDITTYYVVEGDTINSVATKFGITSDSIRWSNDLATDTLSPNQKLRLPPVKGLIHIVEDGDTPESLAQKYNANKEQIIVDNDAELSGFTLGEEVLIRDGVKPVVRLAVNYSANYGSGSGFAFGDSAVYGFNGYYYGWCTWWAAVRRIQTGNPVPANLGDAWTWAARARLAGISTGGTPRNGAVIMTKSGPPGHVGFVEKVLEDGSIWVSDMNSSGFAEMDENSGRAGGWNRVSYRRVFPDQFSRFEFIY